MLTKRYGKERVRSGHIYQVFAYMRNLASAPDSPARVEGMLLYPAVDNSLDSEYEVHGHRLRVFTVDLDRDWADIHRSLLERIGAGKQPADAI